jgi:hypothetical protein
VQVIVEIIVQIISAVVVRMGQSGKDQSAGSAVFCPDNS